MKQKLLVLGILLSLSIFYRLNAQTTWTGAASDQDWFNVANWDAGVPGVADEARIPNGLGTNYPSLTAHAEVNRLFLTGGGTGTAASITFNNFDITVRERFEVQFWGETAVRQIGTNTAHTGRLIIQPNSTNTTFRSDGRNNNVVFNVICDVTANDGANRVQFAHTVFNNTLTINQSDATSWGNVLTGANTYNADATFNFTGGQWGYIGRNDGWFYGGTGDKDTFNQNLTVNVSNDHGVGIWADVVGDLTITTTDNARCDFGTTISACTVDGTTNLSSSNTSGTGILFTHDTGESVTLNGNLNITSTTNAGRVRIGDNGGIVTLATGTNIDASSTIDGQIIMENVVQTAGGTPSHDFTTTASTQLFFTDNTFHGDFTATANRLQFRKNTIGSGTNTITLTKNGSTGTDCGGNTFKGDLTLTMESTVADRWRWGWNDASSNGGADIVEQNLTVNSHSTSNGYISLTQATANNQYNSLGGNTIFNLTNEGRILLGGWDGTTRSFTMGGNLTINNASNHTDGEGAARIGSNGNQVITGTISGSVTLNHTGTSITHFAEESGSVLNIGGNIDLNMTADGEIRFGDDFGNTILASGMRVDASATTDGLILLENVTQTSGGTPNHDFTTNASTDLYFIDSELQGNVTSVSNIAEFTRCTIGENLIATADRLQLRQNTIGSGTSTITLTKNGSTATDCGGNTLKGDVTLTMEATVNDRWRWGWISGSVGGPDIVEQNLTVNSYSTSGGYISFTQSTANNQYNSLGGNTIFNLTNNGRIMLGGWDGTTRSFTMGGNLTINNASSHTDGEGATRICSHSSIVTTGIISGNVILNHTGTSITHFTEANGASLTINGNIDLNMSSDAEIRFGDNGGVTTLASGVRIDASATTDGLLVLKNVVQIAGASTQNHNFTTNVGTDLFFADNTFHGNFSALGNRMHFRRNTIGTNNTNTATLTLPNGSTLSDNNGGNTYHGVTTITHNANGRNWYASGHNNGGADTFNADATFVNNSDNWLNIARNTLNNTFNGNTTFDNAGSGLLHLTEENISAYDATPAQSAIFNGDVTFINSSAGASHQGRPNAIGIARAGASRVTFNADVSFTNNASNGNDGNIAVGTYGGVTFNGNITVNRVGTSSAFSTHDHFQQSGRIYTDGTADQTITSNQDITFRYLELNKTVGAKLILGSNTLIRRGSNNPTLDAELIINSGHIELGNNNLTLEYHATRPANLTGGDANNYIITNGTGYLNMRVEGTNKFFPIGPSDSQYLPITLNNSGGTDDNYSVRAIYDTYETYTALNATTGADVTEYFVDNAWAIQEDVIGGSNLVVTPQWGAGNELTNFDRTQSSVNRFNHDDNEWNCGGADAAASGSGPYTHTSCAFNSTSTNNVGVISVASTVADAGADITIGGCGSANLSAVVPAGTGPGTWTLVAQPSGASASIASMNDPNTAVSGMDITGTYTFRWTTQKASNCATCTPQQDDVDIIYTYSPPGTTTNAVWTGLANNGRWDDCLNWVGEDLPLAAGANVTIPNVGALAYPILPNDVNIINLDIQSGAGLDLDGYTAFISGTSTVVDATITSNGGTFEKTGTNNDTWAGNNTFIGDITFRHSGAGGTWILGGTNADDFNPTTSTTTHTVTFDIANAAANIIPAYNGNTTIEGNIIINSVASADFHFGNMGGNTGGVTLDGGVDSHNRITTIDNNLPTGQKIVYYNFTMDKNIWAGGVEVDGTSHIQNILTLTDGHIKVLDGAIFSVQNSAVNAVQPTTINTSSLVLAQGTGVFGRQVLNNTSDYIFPVARHGYNGTAGVDRRFWSHHFEYVLNLGVGSDADEFFIRLGNPGGNPDATYDLSNNPTGADLTQEYMRNTWIVTHANTTANFDAIVKLFWYHDEPHRLYEQADFEPTRAFITRYDYTAGEWVCLQTATTANQVSIGTPTITNRENRLAMTSGINKASNGNFGIFSVASATADVSNTLTTQTSCGNVTLDASAVFESAAEGVWTTTAPGVIITDPSNPVTTAVNITSSGTYAFTWTRESVECGTNIHAQTVNINVTIGGTPSVTQTWTGAKNTNWFDCANWTDGVPTTTTDVIIPNDAPRYPVLTADVLINSLMYDDNGTTTGASIDFNGFALATGTLEVKDWTPTAPANRTFGTGAGTLNVDGHFIVNGRNSRVIFNAVCNLANLAGDTDYSYIFDADFNSTTSITNRKTSTWQGIFIGDADATDVTNFNSTVTFTIDSPSSIRVARGNSTVNFAENVTFTSTANATGAEARLQLGNDGGTLGNINLADGKTLTTSSFISGRLWISQVTQTGATSTHTHNLDQVSPAELRLRNNTLLGNFEVEAVLMEFRGNTFNTNATNSTIILGNTETDRNTNSGGNTFRGETWITNSGRGDMYFGHSDGGADIFETDAHFVANESGSPATPPTRTTNYNTSYSTGFSTSYTTTHPTPVDYIDPADYYVFGNDHTTWTGIKVGFSDYPRQTNLETNTADPAVNAANAAANIANDALNKADEATSETNFDAATVNVTEAEDNADTVEGNLASAVATADAILASTAGDAGYLDPAYNPSMIPLYNALQTIRNTGDTYIGTVTANEALANAAKTDLTNAPGNDNNIANNANTVANQGHDYVNQIYAAINALRTEVNTQNAAYNATLTAAINNANNTGVLAVAHNTAGNEFRGNTDFDASNKARIWIAQAANAEATFQGTTLIDNTSEGGSGQAYLISDDAGGNVIFQDVVTINQNGTGYIRAAEQGDITFQANVIINNLGGGNTIIGENNDGGVTTVQADMIIDLSAGRLELSSIQKTSTTPLTIEAKNDADLLMRGTSNIQGDVTLIDNSTERGLQVAWNTGNVITFEDDITIRNENTRAPIITNTGITNFNGNVTIENTYALPNNWDDAVIIGANIAGTSNLAAGGVIEVGSNGFAKGQLRLHYFNQFGTTPQHIQLHTGTVGVITSEAQLSVNETDFQAVATFEAAELLVNNSEFDDETTLIAWENGENSGGNVFNDRAFYEFRSPISGSGWNIGRGGAGDTYHDDVEFWNRGNNTFMAIADQGPSNTFFGTQVTIINGSSDFPDSGCDFAVARLATSTAEFDANVVIDNRDANGSIVMGEQGDIVFKQDVTITNAATGLWEGNLVMGGWNAGVYNGSILFEPTSSFTLDASTTWERGRLVLRNTTYQPATPLNFVFNSANDTRIYTGPNSLFEADFEGRAGHIFLNGATFNGTATFEKSGPHWRNTSDGGNVYNGTTHIINHSSGWGEMLLANTNPDDYNADVTFELRNPTNNARGWIIPAYHNTASFAGNVTIISDVDDDFYFSGTGGYTPSSGAGTGSVRFDGSGTQTVTNNIANTAHVLRYRRLEMYQGSPTDIVETNRDFTVTDFCEFSSGKINLGAADMTIENSNNGTSVTVLNVNDSHVIATNSGEVIREVPSTSTNVIFPVGTTGTYLPATLANSGTADTYRVRLIDNVFENYGVAPTFIPGPPPTPAIPIVSHFTRRTWVIDENTAGGSNIDLTLQWDPADELPNFDRNLVSVVQYNNSTNNWRCTQTAGPASGTAGLNLRRSTSGITFMGAFSVTTIDTEAGADQIHCGPTTATMAATPLLAPFSGEWVQIANGSPAATITDINDPNTTVVLPTGGTPNLEYIFEWKNSGLEGVCGTSNLASQVKIEVGSGTTALPGTPLTWTGIFDDNWFNCSNWTPTAVPDASNPVTIPDVSALSNAPVINATGALCERLTMDNGATLNLTDNANITVHGNAVINTGASFVTTATNSEARFQQDLTVNGTFTTADFVRIDGTFTNAGTYNVSATGAETELQGDFVNNVTFAPTQGRFTFSGNNTTLSGTGDITLYNMNMDKNAGEALTLNRELEISNDLDLSTGFFNTTTANKLILLDDATSEQGNGGSYVNGPMRKIGDDAFVFPIGKAGRWARIAISSLAATDVDDFFDAEYFMGNSPSTPTNTPLNHVSVLEHWDLDRGNTDGSGGTTQARVTLYWQDGAWSQIEESTPGVIDLTVANWSGGAWNNRGGNTVGSIASGNVTTPPLQAVFGPFTFGSITGDSPLPITLLSFEAEKTNQNTVVLDWTTSTEKYASHFEVERSYNLEDFELIANVEAVGNSTNIQTYTTTDLNPLNGQNYYRLKMVDEDGSYEYSQIEVINIDKVEVAKLENIYPNPFRDNLTVELNLSKAENYHIRILDNLGRIVFEQRGQAEKDGLNKVNLALGQLSEATYILDIILEQEQIKRKVVKIN